MFSNIYYSNNFIHLWEYDSHGQRVYVKLDFEPYCYIPAKNGTFFDIYGKRYSKKFFDTQTELKKYADEYPTAEGDIGPITRFLIDQYADTEFTKFPKLHKGIIDIETAKGPEGYSGARLATGEVKLICYYSSLTDKYYAFGTKDYNTKEKNVEYIYCDDEVELLKKFTAFFKKNYPDIITGWNSDGYDIPYVINRSKKTVSDNLPKKLSPIDKIEEFEANTKYGKQQQYRIAGITQLDYQILYEHFSQNSRESYKLDFIAKEELGVGKLEYEGTLDELWEYDFQKYVDYCLTDVKRVKQLDDKLKFIDLVQTYAYTCKIPLDGYKSTMKKFENFMLAQLKPKNIVLPTRRHGKEKRELLGGYVAEPIRGYKNYIVSFDFTSLYPFIMMGLNLSPETLVGKITDWNPVDYSVNPPELNRPYHYGVIEDNKKYNVNGKDLTGKEIKSNYIIGANGTLFSKDKKGIIPELVKFLFDKRKSYKDQQLENERLYEKTKEEKYKDTAKRLKLYQLSVKSLINGAYGILSNDFFRFYDIDLAEAVTSTGQHLSMTTKASLNQLFKEKFGYNENAIVAVDTDSAYVCLDTLAKKYNINENTIIPLVDKITNKVLLPHFDKLFTDFSVNQHGMDKNYFNFKREKIAKGAIFVQKKRYALYVIAEESGLLAKPQVKVTGLEVVRSSTPSFCRAKIKEALELIFKTNNEQGLIEFIKQVKEEFKKRPISEISRSSSANNIGKFKKATKSVPMHVRGALNFNKILDKSPQLKEKYEQILEGEKIYYVFLLTPNPINQDVLSFKESWPKEFKFDRYVDFDRQFETCYINPLQNIVGSMGWDISTRLNTNDLLSLWI